MNRHENQKSLTEGRRALQLFTNRNIFIRLFTEYLNSEPPYEKVLFFHGDGGNGKSLLLKILREKYCKRFSSDVCQKFGNINEKDFSQFIDNIKKEDYKIIPSSILDFGHQPREKDQPQDPFYGLLMLRRKLSTAATELNYRLQFPLFDFACSWYLHNTGKSKTEINQLFPPEEMELIGIIIDLLLNMPFANLIITPFGEAR